MHIAIITSLFRSEKNLRSYSKHLLRVAKEVNDARLSLEVVVVANDASSIERDLIKKLVASSHDSFVVKPLYVDRETIYASWNRGIETSTGTSLAIWNVDDIRTSAALIEGHRLVTNGCKLVDFPYTLEMVDVLWGIPVHRSLFAVKALPYDVEGTTETDKPRTSPFFMFSRELYNQTGVFDARFKVAGDFEWQVRAARITKFWVGQSESGTFFMHGSNLSAAENPLTTIEANIIYLLNDEWDGLTVTQPDLMQAAWKQWNTKELPTPVEEKLWGKSAWEMFRLQSQIRHQTSRQRRRSIIKRAPFRFLIDLTHLRPFLAKLGVVKPAQGTPQWNPPLPDRDSR